MNHKHLVLHSMINLLILGFFSLIIWYEESISHSMQIGILSVLLPSTIILAFVFLIHLKKPGKNILPKNDRYALGFLGLGGILFFMIVTNLFGEGLAFTTIIAPILAAILILFYFQMRFVPNSELAKLAQLNFSLKDKQSPIPTPEFLFLTLMTLPLAGFATLWTEEDYLVSLISATASVSLALLLHFCFVEVYRDKGRVIPLNEKWDNRTLLKRITRVNIATSEEIMDRVAENLHYNDLPELKFQMEGMMSTNFMFDESAAAKWERVKERGNHLIREKLKENAPFTEWTQCWCTSCRSRAYQHPVEDFKFTVCKRCKRDRNLIPWIREVKGILRPRDEGEDGAGNYLVQVWDHNSNTLRPGYWETLTVEIIDGFNYDWFIGALCNWIGEGAPGGRKGFPIFLPKQIQLSENSQRLIKETLNPHKFPVIRE